MKRKASSNFGYGGTYVCRLCERRTRATGRGDNDNVRLCAECYELAGIENAFLDGQGNEALAREAKHLLEECQSKGGKVTEDDFEIDWPK